MAVLNMVRQGLFGELIHLQGGYQHNLQGIKFNNGQTTAGSAANSAKRPSRKPLADGTFRPTQRRPLPTHGIGPLAHYIDINRGNLFTTLCSFSTKSRASTIMSSGIAVTITPAQRSNSN